MKAILKSIFIIMALLFTGQAYSKEPNPFYYQIKVYHFKTKTQEARLDDYLQNAYLPALHRAGVKSVGVFKLITQDSTDQLIYVFTPFAKIDQALSISETLNKDSQYLASAKEYTESAWNDAPYTRMESILLTAFTGMPAPALPKLTGPKRERVYELRSYESATESLGLNKIGMFNKDELSIFTGLNFNAVFYGQVIAGSKMPNLMYMTTFNNKADRDKHWMDFNTEYKKVSGKPEYQHNTSKNVTLFLYPVEYSDY